MLFRSGVIEIGAVPGTKSMANSISLSNGNLWRSLGTLPHKVGPKENIRDLSGGDCDALI